MMREFNNEDDNIEDWRKVLARTLEFLGCTDAGVGMAGEVVDVTLLLVPLWNGCSQVPSTEKTTDGRNNCATRWQWDQAETQAMV